MHAHMHARAHTDTHVWKSIQAEMYLHRHYLKLYILKQNTHARYVVLPSVSNLIYTYHKHRK